MVAVLKSLHCVYIFDANVCRVSFFHNAPHNEVVQYLHKQFISRTALTRNEVLGPTATRFVLARFL